MQTMMSPGTTKDVPLEDNLYKDPETAVTVRKCSMKLLNCMICHAKMCQKS